MTPFLKWVGGKRQLLTSLSANIPETFGRYFEPFIGGGALFFELGKKKSYISDVNQELINTYKVLANYTKLSDCIALLRHHAAAHDRKYYYAIRAADRLPEYLQWSDVQRAARFIYLIKTCFNGIWRVNGKGHNNVPMGDAPCSAILDEDNLLQCHGLLETTEIAEAGFEAVVAKANPDDLVYFDPPYVPLSATSSFTSYSKDGFTAADQRRLRGVIDQLHANGVHVMVSNSYCAATQELYAGYHQLPVRASRMVNANGAGRGKINELLVTTYPPPGQSPLPAEFQFTQTC